MLEKVAIVGARKDGHGKVVLETFRAAGTHEVVGFIDDNPSLIGTTICGAPVIGGIDVLPSLRKKGVTSVIVGIGDGRLRQRLASAIIDAGFDLANCIHPSAIITKGCHVGRGIFIGPNVVVVAGASVGDNVIVNTAATVDHDCVLESCTTICPGVHLAGRVTVQEGAFLSTGVVVIPDVVVGEWSTVGAGSVVIRDVPAGVTVVGVPAVPYDKHEVSS